MSIDHDVLLFAVFPYVAFVLRQIVEIQRYAGRPFTFSSLSSQFLENRHHFWGSVPFHYGLLTVLAGHFVAFLVPRGILLWNGHPLRLYILELSAFVFGVLALVGIVNIILRRFFNPKLMVVTSVMDRVLFGVLFFQMLSGISIAVFYRWGSSWYASAMSPYLWSLVTLRPDISFIAPMPLLVKFHVANAYLILALIPYSRLVHFLVAPFPYLWRRPQIVRWNYDRRRIRMEEPR